MSVALAWMLSRLTVQAKLKLAIKLIIIFLLFGRDTIWRIPRKRVARGGQL